MSAAHSDFSKTTVISGEFKEHPIITAYKDFYARVSIVDAVKNFISGDKQAELELLVRLEFMNAKERTELEAWIRQTYFAYLTKVDDPRLSALEQVWLGLMHQHGICTTQNVDLASYCYQLAAAKGNTFGLTLYAKSLPIEQSGIHCVNAMTDVPMANLMMGKFLLNQIEQRNRYHVVRESDLELYKVGDELGDAYSAYELGQHYYTSMQYSLAMIYFNKAAARGHCLSLTNLGRLFEFEEPVDLNVAQSLYELFLERSPNNSIILNFLGRVFFKKNDLQSAALYFRKAEQYGHRSQDLFNLFQEYKNDPYVCYCAATSLSPMNVPPDPEVKAAFNKLLITQPEFVADLSKRLGDTPDKFKDLIDYSKLDMEYLRILQNIVFETLPMFSIDVCGSVLEFLIPTDTKVSKIKSDMLLFKEKKGDTTVEATAYSKAQACWETRKP